MGTSWREAVLWIVGGAALAAPAGEVDPGRVAEAGSEPAAAHATHDRELELEPGPEPEPAAEPGPDDDGLEALRERVRDRDTGFFAAKGRRAAVRRLAGLDRAAAWELVLEALADPVPMVADEAQWQLAGLRHPPLVAELLGRAGLRSREERVPERAAEVLGRLAGPIDGEALTDALRTRDDGVRRMLLWSLERLAARGALTGDVGGEILPHVLRLADREREPGVRAAALAALAVLVGAPDVEARTRERGREVVEDGLREDDPHVRCGALRAVAPLFGPEATGRILAAADDPAASVRTQVALSLAALGSAAGARGLARRLGAETELRPRWRIVELLRELSGRRYGLEAELWRRWAEGLAEDAVLPVQAEAGPATGGARAAERRSEGVSFAELRLRSERVAFLMDFSGSIDERFDGERTRRDYLFAELDRALHALDERTRFNLVPYSDEPEPWERGLVPATRRRVERALDFFGKNRRRGSGDFWEAALLALEDPELDTVVVFTDGAPTGGERWHLALMVDLLLERNRFRHVTFDSILVGAPSGLQNEWRRLAEATHGESVVLEPASADFDG